MKKSNDYYSLDNVLAENPTYAVIVGERSNGKTYAALELAIKRYCETGEQTALIRRWAEDFIGKRGQAMFNAHIENGVVTKYSNGEWTGVYYYASKWYLCRYENGKRVLDEEPMAYGFAISSNEHDKSTSYPKITLCIFDEFIARGAYLPDEFVLFMNTLSTIIRDRNNVLILMLGNTVNMFCPYFNEMGLTRIKEQKQDTIDYYRYGESKLLVAVEYCGTKKKSKQSNHYFAFDNQKLNMITEGQWELDIYPHAPCKWKDKEVVFSYFIDFDKELLQADLVAHDSMLFTYIHRKTGSLKYPEDDLIYSTKYDPRPNWKRKITKPTTELEKRVLRSFNEFKVFYQDNTVGEIVRNYFIWCRGGENI